jgi:hypothetical protein
MFSKPHIVEQPQRDRFGRGDLLAAVFLLHRIDIVLQRGQLRLVFLRVLLELALMFGQGLAEVGRRFVDELRHRRDRVPQVFVE